MVGLDHIYVFCGCCGPTGLIRVRAGTSESHVMALKLKRLQVREELLPLVKSSDISCSQAGEKVRVRWTVHHLQLFGLCFGREEAGECVWLQAVGRLEESGLSLGVKRSVRRNLSGGGWFPPLTFCMYPSTAWV